MCLATENAGTTDGVKIIQQTCNSSSAQMWKLTSLSTGVYEISLYNTAEALDVTGNSTSDGAQIQVWTYGGGNNEKWTFTQVETTIASVAVTGVTMSPTTSTIVVSSTQQLAATVSPSNAKT